MAVRGRNARALSRSKAFRGSFGLLMGLFAALFALGLALITAQRLSLRVRELSENASRVAAAVQEELSAAKTSAVTLASSASATHLLGQRTPLLDTLLDMDEDLTASFLSRQSYQSIELFLLRSGRVCLSRDGVQDVSGYRDQAFVASLPNTDARGEWIARDYRLFGTQQSARVLTYVCPLPLYEVEKTAYIAVNLKWAYLSQTAQSAAMEAVCVWLGDTWIARDPAVEPLSGAEESLQARAADGRYILCRSSDATEVQAAYCVNRVALALGCLPDARATGLALLGGLALSLAAALAVASRALAPAKRLLAKMQSLTEARDMDADEFDLLESAFAGMATQLSRSQRTLIESQPILREHGVGELLMANGTPEGRAERLRGLGIRFPHRYFAVVILTPPECDEQTRQAVRRGAEDLYRTVGEVYSTYAEMDSFAFVINAPEYEGLGERLARVGASLRASVLSALGAPPAISVAVCDEREPVLLYAYQRARRNLPPADEADEESAEAPLSGGSGYATAVDAATAQALSDAVIRQNPEAGAALLARLRREYFPDGLDADRARELAMQLCFQLMTTLLEREMRIADDVILSAVRRIGRAEGPEECVRALEGALEALIPRGELADGANEYVLRAREYIAENYRLPLSVPQIAESVHINSVYLNKLFRIAVGTTISDYLNRYRAERALPLLQDPTLTVTEISARVGFSEPRGFIRNFKKFYSVTPGEYRKTD